MSDRPVLDYSTGEGMGDSRGRVARRHVRKAFKWLLVALFVAFLTLGEFGKPCALLVPFPSLVSFVYCALALCAGTRSRVQDHDPADAKWAVRRAWALLIGLVATNLVSIAAASNAISVWLVPFSDLFR